MSTLLLKGLSLFLILCLFISGLVRGVDPVKKEIYIVTSVESSSLRHVNTFIKGPVTVPDIVFIKQVSKL